MTNFTVNGFAQTLQSTNPGEIGVIGPDGFLVVNDAIAVVLAQVSTLMMHGTIAATSVGVAVYKGAWVFISQTGSITARDYGVYATNGGATYLSNAGEVVAFNQAILFTDEPDEPGTATVINTGTIISQAASAFQSVALENVSLTNHGLIDGAGYGIEMTGDQFVQILNTGTVHGLFGAIYMEGVLPATVINRGMMDGRVTLGNGNDRFLGRQGSQSDVYGWDGNDVITGGASDEQLYGGNGNDDLQGGGGDDEISGGLGNDRILGGLGADTLSGNGGKDRFVFRPSDGHDSVIALAYDAPGGMLLNLASVGGGTVFLAGFSLATFDATDMILG
jgi:Ca2+-binding RTX toxin-like protein